MEKMLPVDGKIATLGTKIVDALENIDILVIALELTASITKWSAETVIKNFCTNSCIHLGEIARATIILKFIDNKSKNPLSVAA